VPFSCTSLIQFSSSFPAQISWPLSIKSKNFFPPGVTLLCAELRCYVHSYVIMCTVTLIRAQLHWYVHSYVIKCTVTFICAQLHWNVHSYIDMCTVTLCSQLRWYVHGYVNTCTVNLLCAQLRWYVHGYVNKCTFTWLCAQLQWYVHGYIDIYTQLLSRSVQIACPEEIRITYVTLLLYWNLRKVTTWLRGEILLCFSIWKR